MKARPVELGAVAAFIRGVTFKPHDVTTTDGANTVACMRTSNVQTDLDTSDVWRIPRALVRRSDQFLASGDILVSSANSWNLVGRCCWIPDLAGPATFGGFVSVLRADPAALDPRYAYWWFSSPRTQQMVRSFGRRTTSISNLDLARCLRLKVPLPPLHEQRRIVSVLDAAEALASKRRKALAVAGQLVQSLFAEMFGHSDDTATARLAEIVASDRPITYGILKPGPDVPNGVPYVRVVDIDDSGIRTEAVRRTTVAIAREYRRSTLTPGDLVMSIRGHVGRLALVPRELDGANITQDSARLAVSGYDPRFVMESIRSPSVQSWMRKRVKGAAVQGINLADVKLIPIPQAPIAAQRDFAARAAASDRVLARASQQLRHCGSLVASLQHRAFVGEL